MTMFGECPKPHLGSVCDLMKTTWLRSKYAFRRTMEETSRANALAISHFNEDTNVLLEIRKTTNNKTVPEANSVNGVVGSKAHVRCEKNTLIVFHTGRPTLTTKAASLQHFNSITPTDRRVFTPSATVAAMVIPGCGVQLGRMCRCVYSTSRE